MQNCLTCGWESYLSAWSWIIPDKLSLSASQISHILWDPRESKGSLACSKVRHGPYPKPAEASP